MTKRFPPAPPIGTPMLATRPSEQARALLALRRSAGKHTIMEPGPSADDLMELLTIATRVPDHRKLEPWRFIVFMGDDRAAFGKEIAQIFKTVTPDASPDALQTEAARLERAPTVVAVISSPDKAHKTPVWEQELSAGAVCQNLLLAANASGWAGVWLTEWISYHAEITQTLGLTPDERIAGFIYLGTPSIAPPERPRANINGKVSTYSMVAKS
ncbi:MAG: nitroreductase [Hyphomonadaceae bacterium]